MSEETSVAIRPVDFSEARVQLLKNTVCKGMEYSDAEFELFIAVCRAKNLDPIARQIYAMKRYDSASGKWTMTFQVGIDGFRLIAQRTGRYAGQGATQWCGEDGVWRDVWLLPKPPSAAKATVYRKDWTEPMVKVALYREYVQLTKERDGNRAPTAMWQKMPASQLQKCAEAIALRAAFPEELSGLHTSDEMAQADNPSEEPPAASNHTNGPMQRADIPQSVKSAAGAEIIPDDVLKLWARMTSVKTNVDTFQQLKRELADAVGADTAERMYREKLAKYGVEHSNQFPSFGRARGAARELYEALKLAQTLHVTENDIVIDPEFDEATK